MLAVCASAQVYLRGNGDASYSVNEEFLFTDNGDGTHTLTKSFELKSDFKIATSDWSVLNFGSAGEEAKVGTIRVLNGTDNNVSVSSLINVTSMTLDTNANTLTIVGENAGEITYSSWTICGVGELVGDAWYPASTINVMTESDGVYTLIKKNVSLSSDFITDADNPEKATLGYGYKVVADAQWGIKEYPAGGANQFVKIKNNGIYDVIFTFNPFTKELSASATLISESGNNNDYIKDDCYKNGIYYNLDHINKTAEVTFGDKSYADYKEYSGSIIIPASITINSDFYSVTSIGEGAFRGCGDLTSISIPNSVTSISKNAFRGCSGLTSVSIPNSVASIGEGAFMNCSALASISIGNGVVSLGSCAFCDTEIYNNDSNWDWDSGALYIDNCLIRTLNIGKESLEIKGGTRVIADYAVYDVFAGSSVTIPGSVISIGKGAFSHASGLTSVTIPSSVKYIGEIAFSGCSNLTSVTIPNSVISIGGYAFSGCKSLSSVTIPSSVDYIGYDVFFGCSELSSVIWNAKNCKDSSGSPFNSINSNITSFTFGNEVEHITAYLCSNMNNLTSITIPNSVTSIGEGAFSNCSGLTSVTIGDKVECIGNLAFRYCTSLKSIEIGKGVVSIGPDTFWDCYSLTSVLWNAKNCKDDSIWEGTPFYSNESKITSFIFGNEVEHIPAYLCSGLGNLNEVVISNSVTSIGGGAFSSCSNLTKVNYLGTVDEWVEIDFVSDYSNPTYETKELYINNKLLTDIKITSADSIKDYVFYNCESIKSVEIGNNVTFIASGAFYGCTNLSKVNYLGTVDEWVGIDFTSSLANPTYYAKDLHINGDLLADVKISTAESIKDNTFINCAGIKSVEMGKNVTYIGSSAFLGCDNLKKITAYPTKVPTVYYNSFPNSYNPQYNATLYVLCDVYDDYLFDKVFGGFKLIECIAAKEVASPEQVEIEVDEDNNANVIWPSTDGAKKYELEISKNGEVFCTLLFNENGQLTSIDFGKRSASVGFQFTVTGLDGASKYNYSIAAKDEVENVLDSYKGTFTTNGYVPDYDEEDVPTSITDAIDDANITVSGGTISADADFTIYNTVGKDVTVLNGSLQPGVYIISIGEDVVKVMVK